jgi:hypothetical protein
MTILRLKENSYSTAIVCAIAKQLERLAKLRDIHITKVDNVAKMTAALIAIGRGVARVVILGIALSKL